MQRRSIGVLIACVSMLLMQCERQGGSRENASKQGGKGSNGAPGSLDWEWLDPLPSGNFPSAVAYGKGTYVVAADGGTVFISTDGNSWKRKNLGTYHDLKAVAFGADRFVVVGDSGSLFTSTDGKEWEPRNSGDSINLKAVAYGGGKWIAVGEEHDICVSTDGLSWSVRTDPMRYHLRSIAYGAGRFVIAAWGDLYSSIDGETWAKAERIKSAGNPDLNLANVSFLGGKFLVTGYHTGGGMHGTVFVSSDGVSWSKSETGLGAFMLYSSAYLDSNYLVFGEFNSQNDPIAIYSSRDAIHWSPKPTSVPIQKLTAYGSGGGLLVGVGWQNRILTSKDAVHWDLKASAASRFGDNYLRGIVHGSGQFVACGLKGGIFTSRDAKNWTRQETETMEELDRVMFKRGLFVSAGNNGGASFSKDGIHWRQAKPGYAYMPILHAAGLYAAVGEKGSIFTSTDLVSWHREKSGTPKNLLSIAYGAGQFIAVGEDGTMVASTEGSKWTPRTCGTREGLMDIAYAAGRFIAVGNYGVMLSSGDGIHWSHEISGSSGFLHAVTYAEGRFYAAGTGCLLTARAGQGGSGAESKADDAADTAIGLWQASDGHGMVVGTINPGDSLSFNAIENPADREVFAFPELPETGKSISDFVPADWHVLAQATGDLDKDNRPDAAVILQYKDTLTRQGEYEMVMDCPRILAILLQDGPNGEYRLAERSTTFIPSDVVTSRDEPFSDLKIERGTLVADFHLFMNMGGWGAGNYTYQFQYRDGTFILIGSTSYDFSRNGSQPAVEKSYNYLTRKQKTTTWEAGDESGKPSVSWSQFELDHPIGFGDIGDVLGWSVDQGNE